MKGTKHLARRFVGNRIVRRVKAGRVRGAEKLGWSRWSRPGLNGLDVRLADHLDVGPGGSFIEFGANDGIQQSNSYLLEREQGWHGVLIEAVPEIAAECARNRPNATVICAAVTSPVLIGSPLGVADNDLMGVVGDSRVMAGVVTLHLVIEHALGGVTPDLVIVDVEGHELEALAGLDLRRHAPRWLMVETSQPDQVIALLGDVYGAPTRLSHHDYLFARAEPAGGTDASRRGPISRRR